MTTWNEADSQVYRQLAAVAVPDRAEQIAALLTLLPFARDAGFRVVELASGEGYLADAILRALPHATLLALDGSAQMRQATADRLARFGDRAQAAAFDMAAQDWYGALDGADAVVSSLCIHHLDAAGKRALFAAVGERLSRRGAFLIADLVLPARPQARALFAATWDDSARAQASESDLFERFSAEQWNYYRYPDPVDQPAPLFDQLQWLAQAGLRAVDCFWMRAGHAVYGGYKAEIASDDGIGYDSAITIARDALSR